MKRVSWVAWMVMAAGAAACSDADVAGSYVAQITNGADGCALGLTTGSNGAATFNVIQDGSKLSLTIEGFAGGFIALYADSSTLTGSVDGDDIRVEHESAERTASSCKFTNIVRVEANQDGDAMSGRVEYRAATNKDASCGTRDSCLTVQEFNATRPPRGSQ